MIGFENMMQIGVAALTIILIIDLLIQVSGMILRHKKNKV